MSHKKDSSLRQQLVDARMNIIAQLDDLQWRSMPAGVSRWSSGPPDYRSVITELEGQLREIDEILGAEEKPDS